MKLWPGCSWPQLKSPMVPSMPPTALPLLLLSLASCRGDWRQSLQDAVAKQQNGDLASASGHYREALGAHPPLRQNWAVLTNFALSIQPGAPSEAAHVFREVISITPKSGDAHFNLGRALTDVEDSEGAAEAFGESARLNPADADALYELALAQLRQADKVNASVAAARASIALSASDGRTWIALGDGLAALGEWEGSRDAYLEASRLRPEHVLSWAQLGNAQQQLGERLAAEASWRNAIALGEAAAAVESGSRGAVDPAVLSGCHQNLGASLRRAERLAEARRAYSAAVTLEPTSVQAYMGLGGSGAFPTGGGDAERDAYVRHLRVSYGEAIRLRPDHAGAYILIAEALSMAGHGGGADAFGGEGAREMYGHALALLPQNTLALTHVAYADRMPSRPGDNARLMGTAEAAEAAEAVGSAEAAETTGPAEEEEGAAASARGDSQPSVDSLFAPLPTSAAALNAALSKWHAHGVAVFPSLLGDAETAALLAHVREAQAGNHTADYTAVTRDHRRRTHKALPVSAARAALDAIASQLSPFLERALGSPHPSLIESGFMVVAPGAPDQTVHRDVAPNILSLSSMAVSVQVSLAHTHASQGALEVLPGSQTFASDVSDRMRQRAMPHVRVAVPRGSVTVYAMHTMHRGTANTHTDERPFYFCALMGEGTAPPGLAYTIQPADVGRWHLAEGSVQERGSGDL